MASDAGLLTGLKENSMGIEQRIRAPFHWASLPVVYLLACALGIWAWLTLGSYVQAACPPDKRWIGLATLNAKCHYPLWVFFLKDMFGASILAILIMISCTWWAPSSKRAVAFSTALISSVIALVALTSQFNVWANVRSHYVTVGITFSLVLFSAAFLVPRSGVAADRDAD
jgi:heme A synthase